MNSKVIIAVFIGAFLVTSSSAQVKHLSPREVHTFAIRGDKITLAYGRPSVADPATGKPRKIWGGLVPYGMIWRTGADDVTVFTTERPLQIGDSLLAAGSYALFTLPLESRTSKLVFNTQTTAMGNRSILAPATSTNMKDVLNKIKYREAYRPVAPVCLENDAPGIFSPGTPDHYMLFEHSVKPPWRTRVPAICHADGTARLQTVNSDTNVDLFELLTEYKALSGIPVLCNTSANFKNSGFFPDVESAQEWGMVNYIWSGGMLYEKETKNEY